MKSVVGAGVVAVLAALSVLPSFAKGKTPKIPIWDSASACGEAYATSPVMLKECNDSEQTYYYLAESYWNDTPANAKQMCFDRAETELHFGHFSKKSNDFKCLAKSASG